MFSLLSCPDMPKGHRVIPVPLQSGPASLRRCAKRSEVEFVAVLVDEGYVHGRARGVGCDLW